MKKLITLLIVMLNSFQHLLRFRNKFEMTLVALVFCLSTNAQIITTVVGNGTAGYSGDGGQATNAEINNSIGVAFDAYRNMYIADNRYNRIRKIDSAGIITTIVGIGTPGYSGDGGQATIAEIYQPYAIIFDMVGNLYFSDLGNNVIRKVNTAGIITTVAGIGTVGYSGDGGQATAAELNSPNGVEVDAFGNLYIADENNNVVRKVNTVGIITTFAGNGFNANTGNGGYSGDGGQATLAELFLPIGLNFDVLGNLFIAEVGNNIIRKVSTTGIISTVAGTGTYGFSGDGGQATNAKLHTPNDMTFDQFGNMYIADASNNRIRKINTGGIIVTIVGNGTNGYSGDGGLAINAKLNTPVWVCLDALDNLYFSDIGNERIRKVTNVAVAGIEQYTNTNEQVNIYPNPTKDVVNLVVSISTSSMPDATILITDIIGNTVKQVSGINNQVSINVADLSEGVYNVSIVSNAGVANKKIVIVR